VSGIASFEPDPSLAWNLPVSALFGQRNLPLPIKEEIMHGLIYLIGLIVVIMAILSFFGLR
jgi:hypothetical protein